MTLFDHYFWSSIGSTFTLPPDFLCQPLSTAQCLELREGSIVVYNVGLYFHTFYHL